ncbi:MAG: PLP-dependent cysteine synthase family protein [Aureliella sp.]
MPETWVHNAIHRIEADFNRSADTHLIHLPIESCPNVDLYLKDESVHPSGSLKHRLARSLFLYALCNGWIGRGTPIVEASSGSTAISEAYFARLLDLPFHAVVPCSTSAEKISKIECLGGICHPCEPAELYRCAESLATELRGHYMDQFKYAERATDWRGNNNIAESLFTQMALERYSEPTWIVVGAGTGGTSATIGRYIRYERRSTQLCVVEPENSVFEEFFRTGNADAKCAAASRIEGIGRPRVEASFIPSVVDRMMCVPDASSIATVRFLASRNDRRRYGASTGTNLWAAFHLMSEMQAAGQHGSVVTLICDSGERYLQSYYCDRWVEEASLDLDTNYQLVKDFLQSGQINATPFSSICAFKSCGTENAISRKLSGE